MKEIDYRKYRYLGNENDYSKYKLDNFVFSEGKNKRLIVTTNSDKKSKVTELKKRIENTNNSNVCSEDMYNTSYENNDNLAYNDIIYSTNNLEKCDIVSNQNKNTKSIKKQLNIDNNYNINLNNKDLESTFNKKKRSYTDLISDSEVKKILNESYPDEDTDTDYCFNNIYNNSNENIHNDTYINKDKNANVKPKYDYNKKSYNERNSRIADERTNIDKRYNYIDSEDKKKQKNDKNGKNIGVKGGSRSKTGIVGGIILLLIFVITFCVCNYFLPNSLVVEKEEQSLYFVGKYAVDNADADRIKNSFISKGGAGCIYKYNNKPFVIADMYKTEEIAKSIIEKQENKNSFDGYIELKVKKYCYKHIPNNLHSAVSSALRYIDIACFDLQKISYNISSKEMDFVEAKDRIKRLSNNVKQIENIFSHNVGNTSNPKILKLKSQIEISYNFMLDLANEYNLVSKIRETYINIILLHINIIEDSYMKWFAYFTLVSYNIYEV